MKTKRKKPKRSKTNSSRAPDYDCYFPRHFDAAEGDADTIDEAIAHQNITPTRKRVK